MSADATGTWLEVALSLPIPQTFTYLDPRGGAARAELGAQVVVPFGARTVTGFVVGYPAAAPQGARVRPILDVIDGEPALDPEVLALCRWAAAYYLAPLGELLRAALPHSERALSERRVRLTEEGLRLLEGRASTRPDLRAWALAAEDAAFLARLQKAGSLSRRALLRADSRVEARLEALQTAGLVEVGDRVKGVIAEPQDRVVFALPAGRGLPARARVQTALWTRLEGSREGVPWEELSVRERAALRVLVTQGAARIESRPRRRAVGPSSSSESPPQLNADQSAALATMGQALVAGGGAFLLAGITGSGKTEVYLRLIAEARAKGRGALVLVPEIALTPQLAARFRARFGDDVAVLHSALPPPERRAAWRRLRAGEVGIALGARSAVFAPVRALGVVVVDEEHDSSFKQDEGVRYNGRDLAIVRAHHAGAVLVLGSATPSMESEQNVERGRFVRLALPVRAAPGAAQRGLPEVEIVDMRRHQLTSDGLFTPRLAQAVEETLATGDQVILFLNRRGFSSLALCRACGEVIRCRDCAVGMTFHRERARLMCHYCGRSQGLPQACPACAKPALDLMGIGTEQVESVVRERFPEARVARLDRDTAESSEALERVLADVHARRVDILVGTQMVTKGHDFPGVTLVGVLRPDQGMHLPDFRASERTFSLLEQVAGRAGRGERPGRVIVQTYNPAHPALRALVSHDQTGFARVELEQRRTAGYPPYARMAAVRIDGTDEGRVRAVAGEAALRASEVPEVRVRGPAEAPIPRLRGRVRWQVWLTAEHRQPLAAAAVAAAEVPLSGDVRLVVDVDPQSVL